jgi:hypothetical protein
MRTLLLATALCAIALPARAATPSAGVPQVIRSGLFADVNLGGFFTVGGKNSAGESTVSNAQAYLQLGLGYDISRHFAVAASFGLGSSAAACFGTVDPKGLCVGTDPDGKSVDVGDNFTATMFTLELTFKHHFTDRFSLQPRAHVGYAALDPEPLRDSAGRAVKSGVVAGAGVGVEYATHMDHFSIGADVYARYIVGPNILGMAIYPKVKYTF